MEAATRRNPEALLLLASGLPGLVWKSLLVSLWLLEYRTGGLLRR
jgi:hypothetical protein